MSEYISPFESSKTVDRIFTNSFDYTDSTTTKTPLEIFNENTTTLFTSTGYDQFADTGGYDDGARSTTINKRNWNILVSYTAEGMVGFDLIPTLPKRNSGANLGRMYLATGNEPDYMMIFKRDTDQYFNNLTIRYNADFMIFYFACRQLGNTYSYSITFTIAKNGYVMLDYAYKANEVWGTNPVWFGYKMYDRGSISWVYNTITVPTNTTYIRSYTYYTITLDTSILNIDSRNDILSITPKKLYKNIIANPDYKAVTLQTISNMTQLNILPLKNIDTKYSFFIEGLDNIDIIINIKNINTNDLIKVTYNNKDNYIINNNYNNTYILTTPNYPTYNLVVNSYTDMVRGKIEGNISTIACTFNRDSLKIRCYRQDGTRIGNDYFIDANWSYSIPNLNINEKYDIILIDTSKKFEWIVQSSRRPQQYESNLLISAPAIINEQIIYQQYRRPIIIWEYELTVNTNIESTILYYSNEIFNIDDIVKNKVTIYSEYITGSSITIADRLLYKYYIIAVTYSNTVQYSKLITYNNKFAINFKARYNE